MSLNVNVKYLDGPGQPGEKYVKLIFRNTEFKTTKVRGNANIYFGQRFSWPIARKIDRTDILLLKCYSANRIGPDRLLGILNVTVASLISEPKTSIRENLVDEKMRITEVVIVVDIEYFSPITGHQDFSSNAFNYPVFNLQTLKRTSKRVQLPSENSSDEDDDYVDSDQGDDKRDDGRDDLSDISLLPERDFKLPKSIDPNAMKIEEFQISITIVEARGLCGNSINPMFEVHCGRQKKETELKMQTNTPFFNEFFTFDLTMSRLEMMEQIIRLRCYSKSSNVVAQRIFSGKLLGEFSIDAKTVYINEDHSFFRKWAVLIDPKAPTSGEKGYVKVDISVLCAGDKPKRPEADENEENPNIEANILIPKYISTTPRKFCEMAVLIYQAEDLPCMNTSVISNLKQVIYGEGKALTDAYVEVSFAGFSGRTKVISRSYSPDWNQQVIFTEKFPPFVSRLRVAVRDNDMIKDETISTVFLDLHKIMYAGSKEEEGFLPTFGPSWVNLYGTPRTYSYSEFIKGDKGQNLNLAEGVAYRGRLLMAIKTSYQPDSSKIGVDVRPCNPVSNSVAGKKEMYLLFGAFYETTLINEEIGKQGSPISFEMSIGVTGNALDDYMKTSAEKENPTENQYVQSVTQSRFAYTYDNKYFHIPYRNKKPCLFMITQSEDHRPRMFIPNILDRLRREICEYIRQTNYILSRSKRVKARRYLRQCIKDIVTSIDKTLSSVKSCRGTAKKTLLDVKYQRLLRLDLEKMKVKLANMNTGLSRVNVQEKLRECNALVRLLEDKMNDPQHGLPDVYIYMVQNNQRIAYARIKSREILHSMLSAEKGIMSGMINTIYMKKMDISILPERKTYSIQAQIQIYLWLGLLKDMRGYKMGLPEGYSRESFVGKLPPKFIDYNEESMFQLRVYLFMGRNVIGSDDSGLSDPFAKIIIGEHVRKSTIFRETRSPIWDEIIIIDNIIFNYTPDILKSSPPNVVVEIFDWDSDTEEDFLGRVFCQPNVYIKGDVYEPAKLQWWSIFRGTMAAGDILAAFDLIEMDINTKRINVKGLSTVKQIEKMTIEVNEISKGFGEKDDNRLRIPYGIRPALSTYRFEILMWGVRQLERIEVFHMKKTQFVPVKRLGIFPVNQPRVFIDIAGYKIESDKITDWSIQPNFEDNLVHLDLRLPEDTQYWPPIAIYCENSTIFGFKQVVGNHIIINVIDYYERDEIDLDREIDKTTIFDSGETNEPINLLENEEDNMMDNEEGNDEQPIAGDISDGKNIPPDVPRPDVTAPVPGAVEKEKPTVPTEEMESADWWTRYYATIGDLGDSTKEKEVTEKISESESDPELVMNVLQNIEVVVKSDDDEEDVLEIPDEEPKKKKKKKRRKKKKKRKYRNPFQPSTKALFLKEEPYELRMESEFVTDNSWIERIKIYPCELENVKDFDGFLYPFKSFPLYRGKQEDDEEEESIDRFGGVFKGNICIYKIDEGNMDSSEEEIPEEVEDETEEEREERERLLEEAERRREEKELERKQNFRLYKCLRDITPIDFIVRVYIIKAINLHPSDLNGKADPYITVRLGNKEVRDRDNYIPKTLNPMFGRCYELEVTFPQESFLKIQVCDWDRLTKDSLIGETSIDLENRWLSPHQGSCGIMPNYQNHGYLKWKDHRLPTIILKGLCDEHGIEQPVYDKLSDRVDIAGHSFTANTMIEDDDGSQIKSLEPLALKILQNWDDIVSGCKLVPEHIETRPIFLDDKPGIQQGLLEMWVDMYPAGSAVPAPIDITPRKAIGYELRVTVVQTEKVRLVNENFFTKEKTVDIYLKGWMKSTDIDLQKTDVHYRSLSGQGLFNWRFVFTFDYLKAEDCIVYKQKSIYEIDESEYKTPCFLNMQVLDSGIILSDKLIGKMKFRLSRFPQPAKYYRSCDPFQHSEACAKFSLFRNKKVRGWWPLVYNPKDEDSDEEDGEEIGGCVELEIELVTTEEAESNPVGLAREEPMPLEKPNRPDGSFLSFLNPCNTIMYFIKYRLKWILIKILVIVLFVLILALFLYTTPGSMTQAIMAKIIG